MVLHPRLSHHAAIDEDQNLHLADRVSGTAFLKQATTKVEGSYPLRGAYRSQVGSGALGIPLIGGRQIDEGGEAGKMIWKSSPAPDLPPYAARCTYTSFLIAGRGCNSDTVVQKWRCGAEER